MIDKSLDLRDVVRVLQSVDSFTEHIVQDSCHLKENNLDPHSISVWATIV